MKTPRQVNGFLKLFEVFEKAAETEKAREFRAVKKRSKSSVVSFAARLKEFSDLRF